MNPMPPVATIAEKIPEVGDKVSVILSFDNGGEQVIVDKMEAMV